MKHCKKCDSTYRIDDGYCLKHKLENPACRDGFVDFGINLSYDESERGVVYKIIGWKRADSDHPTPYFEELFPCIEFDDAVSQVRLLRKHL